MTCSHTECSHLRMFTLEGFWPMLKGSFWSVAKNLRSLTGVFTFEDVHFEEFYCILFIKKIELKRTSQPHNE
ncbi:hypothetical protein BpHYR1_015110 [Brachionus plicatilis]|uniref:Uncharacterized protein n=1 Tax=Brachionus plicatilis TaxID=10195 RepID=A0A3M7S9P6_BRAPC|nr:hypothetical protein BpHYR1_015110 [Brachionus plicatilis]